MLNVIYTVKACMLIMYTRLTLGLNAQSFVRYLSIYVAIGWLATEIAFFTACRPFSGYWAMPPPDPQCTTLEHYAIIQGCFNITADLMMLSIPLPLITRLSVPWRQKGVLLAIFSMGIFVILAALLTKVFNLTNVWDPSYMLWYTREASVAIYVSNLPMIWPLLLEFFPVLRTLTPGGKASGSLKYGGSNTGRQRSRNHPAIQLTNLGDHKLTTLTTTVRGVRNGDSTEELNEGTGIDLDTITRHGSWEQRSGKPVTGNATGKESSTWDKGGIQKVTTVHVTEEHVSDLGYESNDNLQGVQQRHDMEKGKTWGV
jgi:hypothetical protein